ncbi:uncharacterized protein LOC125178063 [Hyalella azteca]|uniref:Uncharacterized protein LOC125178063 n=1 Tax=Hyalella azteca TaxID=294128 RepID=A0A979FL27_HYAAZ|nr:uncharacterized protein LOC125178063 [Hyalella azteca]
MGRTGEESSQASEGRERARKKNKTPKNVRDKSLPQDEKSHRSSSRSRFLSWRRKCPEKSKSFDQSEIETKVDPINSQLEKKKSEDPEVPSSHLQSNPKYDFVMHHTLKLKSDCRANLYCKREDNISQLLLGKSKENPANRQRTRRRGGFWSGSAKVQPTLWPKNSIDFDPLLYGHLDDGGVWTGEEQAQDLHQPPDLTSQTHWQSPNKLKTRKINVDLLETLHGEKSGSPSPSTTPKTFSWLPPGSEMEEKQSPSALSSSRKSSNSSTGKDSIPKNKATKYFPAEVIFQTGKQTSIKQHKEIVDSDQRNVETDGTTVVITEAFANTNVVQLPACPVNPELSSSVKKKVRSSFKKRGISVPDYGRGTDYLEPKTIITLERQQKANLNFIEKKEKSHKVKDLEISKSFPRPIPARDPYVVTYDWTISPDYGTLPSADTKVAERSSGNGYQVARGVDQLIASTAKLMQQDTLRLNKDYITTIDAPTSVADKSSPSTSLRSSDGNSPSAETFLNQLDAAEAEKVVHVSSPLSTPSSSTNATENVLDTLTTNSTMQGSLQIPPAPSTPPVDLDLDKEDISSSPSWLHSTGGFLWSFVREVMKGEATGELDDDGDDEDVAGDDAFSVKRWKLK